MRPWLVLAALASVVAGCSAASSTATGSGSNAVGTSSTAGCFGGCLCWTTQAACSANGCAWTLSNSTGYLADGAAVDAGLQGGCSAPQSADAAPAGGW